MRVLIPSRSGNTVYRINKNPFERNITIFIDVLFENITPFCVKLELGTSYAKSSVATTTHLNKLQLVMYVQIHANMILINCTN